MAGLGTRLYTTFGRWVLRGPPLSALRRWRPVTRIRGVWLISRHAGAREVLEHDSDFAVPYGPRMEPLIGPFLLGLADNGRHRRVREALDRADGRHDPEASRELLRGVAGNAEAAADALLDGSDGAIDVVTGLGDPVVHAGIAAYLGVEAPDAATLLKWCRAIGSDIFFNPRKSSRVAAVAEEAAPALMALVDASVEERRRALPRAEAPAGTLLDRLLGSEGLDEQELRSTVAGLMVVWAVAVPRAMALAVDELLRRPELAGAQAAARAGDDHGLAMHLLEALRFETLAPAVPRICQGAVLSGGSRQRSIPAGATAVALTGPAMMDSEVVPDAKQFRADRDPGEYSLHFGRGAHACWGEALATSQLTAIAGALLRREGLRRARGSAGRLLIEGAFPIQLGVTFDARPA